MSLVLNGTWRISGISEDFERNEEKGRASESYGEILIPDWIHDERAFRRLTMNKLYGWFRDNTPSFLAVNAVAQAASIIIHNNEREYSDRSLFKGWQQRRFIRH